MSYENPKQDRLLETGLLGGDAMVSRLMAVGLCGVALLLLGCSSVQVSADEGGASREAGTVQENSGSLGNSNSGKTDISDASPSLTNLAQILPVAAWVELGGEVIELEVTRTVDEQATGLMYRDSLADDRGMLFSFEPARPVQFWMKNVVIDLDMVFVHEGKIVGIAEDVPPCDSTPCATYGPGFGVLVDQVIELRGGRAAELGVAVGDAVVVKPLTDDMPSGGDTP